MGGTRDLIKHHHETISLVSFYSGPEERNLNPDLKLPISAKSLYNLIKSFDSTSIDAYTTACDEFIEGKPDWRIISRNCCGIGLSSFEKKKTTITNFLKGELGFLFNEEILDYLKGWVCTSLEANGEHAAFVCLQDNNQVIIFLSFIEVIHQKFGRPKTGYSYHVIQIEDELTEEQ